MSRSGLVVATLACLLGATGYADQVYRSADEAGIPVFSDTGEATEAVDLQEPVTWPGEAEQQQAPGVSEAATGRPAQEPSEQPGYTELTISHPTGDSTIRDNAGTLLLVIRPDLHPGHTAELLMDGQTIRTLEAAGEVTLHNVDRGTHEFSVRILDHNAQEIASSPPTSITLLRTSQIKPAQ